MTIFREKSIVKAMNDNNDILSPYLSRVNQDDARFITAKLSPFSKLIQSTILKEAFDKPSAYERNRHILDTCTTLYKLLPKKLADMFFCFDDDITLKAKECADYCRRIAIDPKAIEFIRLHHNLPVNGNVPINDGVPVNGDVPINEGVLVNRDVPINEYVLVNEYPVADTELDRVVTETISGSDQTTPEFDRIISENIPGSDQTTTEFDRIIPETIPGSDQTKPEFDRTIPGTIAGIDLANPEFDRTIPGIIAGIDLANPEFDRVIPEISPEIDRISSVRSIGEMSIDKQKVAYEYLSRYVAVFNIQPLKPGRVGKLSGCIKRYIDNRWWLRKIRKLITQANEKAAIHLNFVNSKRQIYASNITTKNRITQRLRNDELMSSSYIINELGQRYTLKEVSDLNVSNPKIRKDELICRARGFENLAKEEGHEALFITITCPSKYHRAFSKSGAPNPKWLGLMPDEANNYLNHQWQKARAEFNRKNINPYGFRVVEPQHDGTPHWHMLFFIEGEKLEEMQAIIRHYALEVDGDENGALENRCDFKKIDPAKGSATGYILKYIVKNIDGEGLGEDKFGNDSLLVAQRIDAWASCWRIRQFQQIGGASVSVWRELRRLRTKLFKTEMENRSSVLERARFAADNSDWQGYITAMGGISLRLTDRPIRLYYELNVDEETGECLQSYYDSELIKQVKGLWFAGKTIITRFYQWRIEKA